MKISTNNESENNDKNNRVYKLELEHATEQE